MKLGIERYGVEVCCKGIAPDVKTAGNGHCRTKIVASDLEDHVRLKIGSITFSHRVAS
jgi:hypothetical protein